VSDFALHTSHGSVAILIFIQFSSTSAPQELSVGLCAKDNNISGKIFQAVSAKNFFFLKKL